MKESRARPAPPPAPDPAPASVLAPEAAPAPAPEMTPAPDPEPAAVPDRDPAPAIGPPPRPSFEEVYQTLLPYVLVVLWRLGVASRDIHDVAHEVFLVVHRRLEDHDPRLSLKPWIAGISANVALRHRALARNQRELLALDDSEPIELADPGLDAERRVAQAETQRIVRELIQRMERERRAVFVLYDLEGSDMRDIAQALQIPVNTAWDRLRRARSEFTAAVKRLSARDPDALGLRRLRVVLAPFALADRPMLLDASNARLGLAQGLAGPLWVQLQRSLASTGGLARRTDGLHGSPAVQPHAGASPLHRPASAVGPAGATAEKRTPPVITIARSRLIKAGVALFLGGAGVGAGVVYAGLPPPAAAPVVSVRAEVEGAASERAGRTEAGHDGRAAPERAERAAGELAVVDAVANAGPSVAVATAAAAPLRASPRKAAPPSEHDTTEESALLSSAGLALSEGKATEALEVLALHERSYPRSPRVQLREALAIQALVQAGRRADARARAERFRAAFPHAVFLPAIEAAVNSP
ncbi:RNA polymerase sigma factor [Sorangium atrum]|uniref:RNA polymerase sigma factor n=1 Tax=Sorangium atrum TaxID=2995308 RepID=A0ABT5C2F5_9BACT|nr:RNA polymerase sigma factor [Sorangium aterium]MDC0679949.1 RNA polymerase sigma factor [Sorangium aterium]